MRNIRKPKKLVIKPKAGDGKGKFLYQNGNKAELDLPGLSKKLRSGEQFEGTDYYMQFVPSLLIFVKTLESPSTTHFLQENNQMNEKLITEQPPHVTQDGKMEFVKQPKKKEKKSLNETPMIQDGVQIDEILINEDGLGGIEII